MGYAQTYHYTVSDAEGAPLVRFLDDGTVEMLRGEMIMNATPEQLTPDEAVPEFIIRNGAEVVARIDGVSGNFYLKGGTVTANPLRENDAAREFILRGAGGQPVFIIDQHGNAVTRDKTACEEGLHKVTVRVVGAGSVGPFVGEQCFADGAVLTVTANENAPGHRFDRMQVSPPPLPGMNAFYFPRESFTVTGDMIITVHFQPLDLQADLAAWAEWIFGAGMDLTRFDDNGIMEHSLFGFVPAPNGIPDAAEFALLGDILTDPSHPNFFTTQFFWRLLRERTFEDTRPVAESACGNQLRMRGRHLSAMAAYRMLGQASNLASNERFHAKRVRVQNPPCPGALLRTFWPPPLLSPLDPVGDLDGDGYNNFEEWRWVRARSNDLATLYGLYSSEAADNGSTPLFFQDGDTVTNKFTQITIQVEGNGDVYPYKGVNLFPTYDAVASGCGEFCNDPTAAAPLGCVGCEFNTVHFNAVPAPGWGFAGWRGVFQISKRGDQVLEVRTDTSHVLTARFVPLDSDLEVNFNALWDTYESILAGSGPDRNEYTIPEEDVINFAPNGIPDKAELLLLENVLRNPSINFARVDGIVHQFAVESYNSNLALVRQTGGSALAAYPGLDALLAGYLTLGSWADLVFTREGMKALTGATLDLAQVDISQHGYLGVQGNADMDNRTNLQEWRQVAANVSEGQATAYAQSALGGEAPPGDAGGDCGEIAPEIAMWLGEPVRVLPSVLDQVSFDPLPESVAKLKLTPCGYVKNASGEYVPADSEYTGARYYYPGTIVTVSLEIQDPTYKFLRWSTGSSVKLPIEGSRSPVETFVATACDGAIGWLVRAMLETSVNAFGLSDIEAGTLEFELQGDTQREVYRNVRWTGVKFGETVHVQGHPDSLIKAIVKPSSRVTHTSWESVEQGQFFYHDFYHQGTVLLSRMGSSVAFTRHIYAPTPPQEPITVETETIDVQSDYEYGHVFTGPDEHVLYKPPFSGSWSAGLGRGSRATLYAVAHPGYRFMGWYFPSSSTPSGAEPDIFTTTTDFAWTMSIPMPAAHFKPDGSKLLTTTVRIEGSNPLGLTPDQAGSVCRDNPTKYYFSNRETLEAIPNSDAHFYFRGWEGNAKTTDNRNIADVEESEITIKLEADTTVTAVFEFKPVLVVVLSGEQPCGLNDCNVPDPPRHGNPDCAGDDFDCAANSLPNACSGLFTWAQSLESTGFSDIIEIKMYNEDDVRGEFPSNTSGCLFPPPPFEPWLVGAGPVFDDIVGGLQEGSWRKIALVGHSHGGGSVADLAWRLQHHNSIPYNLTFTAYIDAIQNNHDTWTAAEAEEPLGSSYHVNLYTDYTEPDWTFTGQSVGGALDEEINSLDCAEHVVHGAMDNCSLIHQILTDRLRFRIVANSTLSHPESTVCPGETLICGDTQESF